MTRVHICLRPVAGLQRVMDGRPFERLLKLGWGFLRIRGTVFGGLTITIVVVTVVAMLGSMLGSMLGPHI